MLNNTNNVAASVLSALGAMRSGVIRVLKSPMHPEIDDLVNDAVCRLLASPERLDGLASVEAHCVTVAKNIAKDHCKRAANRPGSHTHVNGTDYGQDEGGTDSLGAVLSGPDGRAVVARRQDLARLEAAKVACLDATERTFVDALEAGADCKDAGALVGWSAPTATRRRVDLYRRLRAYVEA